jgi:hypothetical protein
MKTLPAFFQFLRQNLVIIALILLPVAIFALSSCAAAVAKHEPVVTEKRQLSAYTRIEAGSAFTIDFTTGTTVEATIEAPGDVIGKVKLEVRGDVLNISYSEDVDNLDQPVRIHLTGSALEAVKLAGACDFKLLSNLNGDHFRLGLSGASSFTGTLYMKRVNVELSGASTAELGGITNFFNVETSGASTLRAGKLSSAVTVVKSSGASNATLQADSTLDAEANGASTISYKGEPVVVEKESGASTIRKEK